VIPTRLHDGRTFPSMAAAERALGVWPGAVAYHLDHHGSTALAGQRAMPHPACAPVAVNGVDYPSIAADPPSWAGSNASRNCQ
jgi:hypothetical protein